MNKQVCRNCVFCRLDKEYFFCYRYPLRQQIFDDTREHWCGEFVSFDAKLLDLIAKLGE